MGKSFEVEEDGLGQFHFGDKAIVGIDMVKAQGGIFGWVSDPQHPIKTLGG